jgi:hypothetical protein
VPKTQGVVIMTMKRVLGVLVAVLMVGNVAWAQGTDDHERRIFQSQGTDRRHFEWHSGSDSNLDRVQELLDLTESQVISLEALLEERKAKRDDLISQLRDRSQELEALVPGGDARAVGTAYLAREAISAELRGSQEGYRMAFENLLTTDQKELLETLKKVGGNTIFNMLGLGEGGGEFIFFGDDAFGVIQRKFLHGPE